jgi:hypothetical protein
MKKDPRFTLEIALMADGVPPGEVYKSGTLDVDRAFRSLASISTVPLGPNKNIFEDQENRI